MSSKSKIALLIAVVMLFLCSCGMTISNKSQDKTPKSNENIIADVDLDNTIQNQKVSDNKQQGLQETTDPLYKEWQKNAIIQCNKITREMTQKNWENISASYGFSHNKFRDIAIWPTEEEESGDLFVYTIHGSISGIEDNNIHIVAVVVFTQENPQGEMVRVEYASDSGRPWYPQEPNTICDAYTLELWKNMYSY